MTRPGSIRVDSIRFDSTLLSSTRLVSVRINYRDSQSSIYVDRVGFDSVPTPHTLCSYVNTGTYRSGRAAESRVSSRWKGVPVEHPRPPAACLESGARVQRPIVADTTGLEVCLQRQCVRPACGALRSASRGILYHSVPKYTTKLY